MYKCLLRLLFRGARESPSYRLWHNQWSSYDHPLPAGHVVFILDCQTINNNSNLNGTCHVHLYVKKLTSIPKKLPI